MKHAVDFFYRYAGHVLRPYIDAEPASEADVCGVCNRPNTQWLDPSIKVSFIQYGLKEAHCLSCHSLFEGSFELFGVERVARGGSPVPMKLGMASGCGALITSSETVLFLNGFIDKMEKAPTPPFEMRAMFGLTAYKHIIRNLPKDSEFLFIGNFGRKKQGLVSNLRLSTQERLSICEDSQRLDVPIKLIRQVISDGERLPEARKNKFKAILRGVYTGQIGLHDEKLKKEIDSLRADYPEALKAMKSLPADPHACLNILKLW